MIKLEIIDNNKVNYSMRWIVRLLLVLIVSVLFESLGIKLNVQEDSISYIFGVIGIIFPIAMAQVLSFPFDDIDNQEFVDKYRANNEYLTKSFVVLLVVATFLYVRPYSDYSMVMKNLKLSLYYISDVAIIMILIYYCLNFVMLVKNRSNLSDKLREYRQKGHD